MATTKNGTIPQPVSLRSVRQVVAAQQRTMDALPDVYRELEGRIQVLEGQRREERVWTSGMFAGVEHRVDELTDSRNQHDARIRLLASQRIHDRHNYEDLVAHVDVIGAALWKQSFWGRLRWLVTGR